MTDRVYLSRREHAMPRRYELSADAQATLQLAVGVALDLELDTRAELIRSGLAETNAELRAQAVLIGTLENLADTLNAATGVWVVLPGE
jgi:hypothetical protein